jgi:hypothetical protein
VNISNAVIKTEAMSEWRRYLKWRILTLVAGLGIMEVCSSNEMGAPNASHLEQETTQPNRPKQTKISPGKRARVQWADLPIWTMLFATAIGGRLHDKEQAQADAQSSSKTARP